MTKSRLAAEAALRASLENEGWRPMASAPTDGTMILVCELGPGRDQGQVLPACFMRANGAPWMEGFWGVRPTSRVPGHLMEQDPNNEGFAVRWRILATTPLCWKPFPPPENLVSLRRRQGQLLRRKAKKLA